MTVYATLTAAGLDRELYADSDECVLMTEDGLFSAFYDGEGLLTYYHYLMGDDETGYALVMYDANNALLDYDIPDDADPADYPPLKIIQ